MLAIVKSVTPRIRAVHRLRVTEEMGQGTPQGGRKSWDKEKNTCAYISAS